MIQHIGMVIVCGYVASAGVAAQQPPPDYGHNFITIGDVGNRGYDREDLFGRTAGRGGVDYEYRIARTEITSVQFAGFLNAWESSGGTPGALGALFWGGSRVDGRWVVPAGSELLPVGGISWREAAIYCNWLHNGAPTDQLDAFLDGAYDTSTFTDQPDSNVLVNDQDARRPGARYWIPSLDEWLKAAHWDPDKNGPGDGGWWLYNNGSDTRPEPGLPGVGDTAAGLEFDNFGEEYLIPLESYPGTQTPWGLLDTSGGGTEWTEEWQRGQYKERRVWQGNTAGTRTYDPFDPISLSNDLAWVDGSDTPDLGFPYLSFRLASAVPAPGVGVGLVCAFPFLVRRRRMAAALCVGVASAVAAQQPPPDYGFNFVTIGDVGNRGYDREDLFGRTAGRGTVNYEYRMARTEITTAQFAEFRNAYQIAGQPVGSISPFFWGGVFDGQQFVVPAGNELLPVAGLSWRGAAVICNWLHNGKGSDPSAFTSGAYDTSTFTDVPGSNVLVNDQAMRSPGARYWIPSFDEWLKAAHWDPDKNGPGDGGWWLYNNGSDTQPVIGLPGDGETTAGYEFTGFGDEYDIPLEAYPDTQTPWGLLDTSGGGAEWTEEWLRGIPEIRVAQGNAAGDQTFRPDDPMDFSNDLAWVQSGSNPDVRLPEFSVRIASAVPTPGTGVLLVCGLVRLVRRRRMT